MAVEGPLARTVADLRLGLAVMAGASARDPFAVPAGGPRPAPARPLRVGVLRDPGVVAPVPAVDAALDAAAGWLGDAGYAVEEAELCLFAEAYRLWYLLCIEDNRRGSGDVRELGGPSASRLLDTQLAVERQWWPERPGLDDVLEGYTRRGTLIRDLHHALQELPLLLMPVSAEPAFSHGEDLATDQTAIRLAAAQWPCTSLPLLGFPALAVPAVVADGLPIGVQLVAGRFREDLLFDAAEVIEARSAVPSPVDPSGAGHEQHGLDRGA